MDAARRRFVDDLYIRSGVHDAALSDRLERFRNVEPPTAALLGVLIRATGARRILELGTSNGYSTIWLADAAESAGGSVVTVDVDPVRTELAAGNLRVAGLDALVEFRTGDAAETLARSGDAAWEFVFLDAERPAYPSYVRDRVRRRAARAARRGLAAPAVAVGTAIRPAPLARTYPPALGQRTAEERGELAVADALGVDDVALERRAVG